MEIGTLDSSKNCTLLNKYDTFDIECGALVLGHNTTAVLNGRFHWNPLGEKRIRMFHNQN